MPNDSKALRNLLQAETREDSENVSAADVLLVPGLTAASLDEIVARVAEAAEIDRPGEAPILLPITTVYRLRAASPSNGKMGSRWPVEATAAAKFHLS